MTSAIASEIERYLLTGETDPYHSAWGGDSFMDRAHRASDDLRGALVAEVSRRSAGAVVRELPEPEVLAALTRQKSEPMVRGLFPRAEQDHVLALVERSVVFLTPDTVERVLRDESFDHDAWHLANLYLHSVGAPLLGPDAPRLLGLSQETTCYVTPGYFDDDSPFADFVVHEVAHIFHNCKREQVGLPFTRRREWLLDIAYQKRETFAYACEAFARVLERARRPSDRLELADAFGRQFRPGDERVDADEVSDIVRDAAVRRNGWKVILGRCTPSRSSR
ncbi:MAG: hypothetical protein ABMA64_04085 [Myxococcota bacterium]